MRYPAVLAVALVFAGCAGSTTTIVDCAAAVDWHGTMYVGGGPLHELVRGARLGPGEYPACGPDKPAERVTVYRIRGVPPEIAVIVRGRYYDVPGHFAALPSHPMHRGLFGRADLVVVRSGGRDEDVLVHAGTRVRGPRRFGTPYIRTGDAVQARGRMCVDYSVGRTKFADALVVG